MSGPELHADVHAQLAQIGQADIVVGIPSYNSARTTHVVRAVQAGRRAFRHRYLAVSEVLTKELGAQFYLHSRDD